MILKMLDENKDGSMNATIEGLTQEELLFFAKKGIIACLIESVEKLKLEHPGEIENEG